MRGLSFVYLFKLEGYGKRRKDIHRGENDLPFAKELILMKKEIGDDKLKIWRTESEISAKIMKFRLGKT